VLESGRIIGRNPTLERRMYSGSLPPDLKRILHAICGPLVGGKPLAMTDGVSFNDDQMRLRTKGAAHNIAVLKHITLNLIRLDPIKRNGGIKANIFIANSFVRYRTLQAQMISVDCPGLDAAQARIAVSIMIVPFGCREYPS
jgi:hypothetical protein